MTAIRFPDFVDDRADALAGRGLDGLKLALVTLPAGPNPDHADVDLRFFNGLHVAAILADVVGDPVRARQVFRIRGGSRIVAGSATGQVQVTDATGIDATRIALRVAPVGDYSTYTLELVWDASRIDPFFSSIGFKFRPGCFTNDCSPVLPGRPAAPNPAIDYLAKDYDSFRHTLMTAMAERAPGWTSTSEADHDQVLIDLFAAAADELSDFQDRVMAEAYVATTRKRVSLARHARLFDYHLHEGNQSSTWLAVDVVGGQAPFTLDDQELVVWTGPPAANDAAVFFASRERRRAPAERQRLDPLLNRLRLHTWRNAQPALAAGSTSADIAPIGGLASQAAADALRDLVRQGLWREMLVVEVLNPLTGAVAGRRRAKRQLLRFLPGDDVARGAAESVFDPVTGTWIVRVRWRDDDALRFDYSFTTFCPGPPPATVEDVSLFYGNLVTVHEGRPLTVHFREPGDPLPTDTDTDKHRWFERMDRFADGRDWVLAPLPDEGPLAYLPPSGGGAPTGEEPARSTLWVEVEPPGGARETWDEVESLVHSDDSAENGDHFMVETDERGRSVLRLGNGTNGRPAPPGAIVHAAYQIGGGHAGNVGADQLVNVRPLTGALNGAVVAATNPFDVTDGRDPEPAERIRRNAPEAFRARQLRAVTPADYVKRAEEVAGVSRAVARYAWTGSWRTVRVSIDPAGFTAVGDAPSDALWDELRPRVAAHLEAVRLIGEDLELRPPRYVPLEIRVVVCAGEAYWREDLRFVLEREFSDGWTSDGRRGFFHPDEWTFGTSLHRSAIEGRIDRVAGVKHVVSITMKRFSAPLPGVPGAEALEIGPDEIVLLANDPDHLERGLIRFDIQGGERLMACDPLIRDPFVFPRRASNRAGLPRIAYRIGRYADFVEAMKRGIDAAPELAGWTHRDADDPGIALLEGAAVLGDILTFYQEHYANEAYLRTAAWRESVAELVRLTGYRLAPGIGGRATLAFEVRGDAALTIREGFPLKAELEDADAPADFQTDAELAAWPHLGRFNLYRARVYAATLAAGATSFELASVDGAGDAARLEAFDLKIGDRLLLLPSEPGWTSAGTTLTAQKAPQVVKVEKVTRLLGRVIVAVDAPILQAWNQPVAAYRVNRTFRHFGNNAPVKTVANDVDGGGTITGATELDTGFVRHVYAGHDCVNTSASLALAPALLPLDAEVSDLRPGMLVVVQTRVAKSGAADPVALAVLRSVAAIEARTIGFGNLNGPSTLLTLNQPLVKHAMTGSPSSDVRDYRVHEVTSPPLTLRPVSSPAAGAFVDGTNALRFWGTAAQAQALAGRRLYLSHEDGRSVELVCTNDAADFVATTPDALKTWPLTFDRPPAPFVRADFDEAAPTVTVFGNLVDASQGKSERDAVLGNGDHRQAWQTFPLPKAPLTYFLSADGTPPQTPELEVRAEGRTWARVDAFFGHGPQERIYIVREDAEGRSFVQFGDGETGARLPSGVKNVAAVYRTGVGAHGAIKPDAAPTAPERPPGFDKVNLAGIVSGGAAPEDAEQAREAAPGKVQSLGRLVSISDYESETRGVPGVVTAAAAWDLHAGVPAVILRVLLEAGREGEFNDVRATLAHAQRCRGPDRFPLFVEQALPRYAFVDVGYARDPSYRAEDVEAALRAALGLVGDGDHERTGLFGLRARRLGEREYASRVEGRLQNVAGVLWCKVTALGRFPAGSADPEALVLPAAPRPSAAVLACSAHELLQLAPQHLTLTPVAEPSAGECA